LLASKVAEAAEVNRIAVFHRKRSNEKKTAPPKISQRSLFEGILIPL